MGSAARWSSSWCKHRCFLPIPTSAPSFAGSTCTTLRWCCSSSCQVGIRRVEGFNGGRLGNMSTYLNCLVVWNIWIIFPDSWDDDPIWLSYFSGGLKPLDDKQCFDTVINSDKGLNGQIKFVKLVTNVKKAKHLAAWKVGLMLNMCKDSRWSNARGESLGWKPDPFWTQRAQGWNQQVSSRDGWQDQTRVEDPRRSTRDSQRPPLWIG